mgnify:CR=1 FL=1|jgi:hypothetical protein
MQAEASAIMEKWRERTKANDGRFLRFLDGDTKNRSAANVQWVHPFDAFSAAYQRLDWTVDWDEGLTESEVAFVKDHFFNFCVTYQVDGRDPEEPPIDRDPESYVDSPEVVALTADGDAMMEAGMYEAALELYEAAKVKRDSAFFGGSPSGSPDKGKKAGSPLARAAAHSSSSTDGAAESPARRPSRRVAS